MDTRNTHGGERDTREVTEQTERTARGGGGRRLAAFKALALLALMGVTLYGTLRGGLYFEEAWLPVAAGILALSLLTLLVRGYYARVPKIGWVLVALLGALVFVKGISLAWTIGESLTIRELLRSAMYLATFAISLAAISYRNQIEPIVDGLFLVILPVAGYGLLQKVDPVRFPIESVSPGRIGSTLDYANTFALVVALGIMLGLARLGSLANPLARGLYAALTLCLCVALFFTFSRGGFLSLGLGLLLFFAVGGNRLQSFANLLLLSAPLLWLLYRTRSHEALYQEVVQDRAATAAGDAFLVDLIVAAVVAFLLQAVYAWVAGRHGVSRRARKLLGAGAVAAVVLLCGVGGYMAFVSGSGGDSSAPSAGQEASGGLQQRLTSLDSLRYAYWKVGLQAWRENPLTGTGAGTFQYTWLQERPIDAGVNQVHNLYLEQGTETGIFAFAAMAGFAAVLALYTAVSALRVTGGGAGEGGESSRTLLAGLSGAVAVYLFSSALEWHWYIPASTLLFFILAAVAVKHASLQSSRKPRA
jgi:hypothetical protein